MQTTVENTDPHKVKLTVEISSDQVEQDLDKAYSRIAQQVKIPGFRKGKVPKQIIDAQIGRDTVIEDFVNESLPSYYREAVREEDLAPITEPDIDLAQLEDGKPLIFTAEMEVRPRLELEDYEGIEVTRPPAEPTDDEVDQMLQSVRDRFAELETVERPAIDGDFVVADVHAEVDGEELAEGTRPDYLYSVGSGEFGPSMDSELLGKKPGDIITFDQELGPGAGERAGGTASFRVLVKEVKGKKLPELDDELAKTASEFDTLDEFRGSLRESIEQNKERQAQAVVRDRVLQELIDRVEVDLPDTLIDEETQQRVDGARERAERSGMTLDQVLEAQGWDEERLRSDARDHAIRAIKADLILESIARSEDLEVSAEELGTEISMLAAQVGQEPKQVAQTLERSGQIVSLASDIIRSKALDMLVDKAKVESESAPSEVNDGDAAADTSSDSDPDRASEPKPEANP
ncbi:MAG: trigger factor [Actinomycetota bacterium]